MSNNYGQGSVINTPKQKQPGPPFASTSANNGLSVDPVSGAIVLGDDVGGVLSTLLSNREIPMAGNFIRLIGTDAVTELYGDSMQAYNSVDFATSCSWFVTPTGALLQIASDTGLGHTPARLELIDMGGASTRVQQNGTALEATRLNDRMMSLDQVTDVYQMGDIDGTGFGLFLIIDDGNNRARIESGGNNYLFLDINNIFFEFGETGSVNSLAIDGLNFNAQIFLNGTTIVDLDNAGALYQIGDVDGSLNSSTIAINDALMEIDLFAGNGIRTTAPSANGNELWRLGKIIAGAVALDATQYVEVNIGGTVVKLLMAA